MELAQGYLGVKWIKLFTEHVIERRFHRPLGLRKGEANGRLIFTTFLVISP
jgi:hypothetical protein